MTLRIKLRRRHKDKGFFSLTYGGTATIGYTTSSGSTLTLGEMERAYKGAKYTGMYLDELTK